MQTTLFATGSVTQRALRDYSHAADSELLACLIGEPIPEVAGRMLRDHGSLAGVFKRDARELRQYPKITAATAARMSAIGEIARRLQSQPESNRVQVCSPDDVADVYGPCMRDLPQEVFKVVFLNTANIIIGDVTLSEGGLAASIVEPRAVFRHAILENAAAVIFIHNHPSGNPEPSREDIRITRQLVEAGKLVGIPVHDHLIIAGTTFTSMAERSLLI